MRLRHCRVDRAARQLVGIGQKSATALLFGDNEGLAGRYRFHRRCGWRRLLDSLRRHDGGCVRGAALALGLERREAGAIALRHSRELVGDARHDIGPRLIALLPEQAHGRIPGIVLAMEHPAPIRHRGQQHPDRLAERAGKMRDRRVDGDDEVERADRAGSIGEICKLCAEVLDRGLALEPFQIGRARAELQASK